LGFFVFVSFGSRGLVLVGFFLSFFGLFFYFKLCVFSCILPVYQGAPDAFNKVSLLLIKKGININLEIHVVDLIYKSVKFR